jgi:hypothetical protein
MWKEKHLTCDLRLSPRLKWTLLSSGLLRGLGWFNTDVSGRPIGPIFKDKAVQDDRLDSPETSVWNDLTMCNNQENEIIQYVTYLHQLLDILVQSLVVFQVTGTMSVTCRWKECGRWWVWLYFEVWAGGLRKPTRKLRLTELCAHVRSPALPNARAGCRTVSSLLYVPSCASSSLKCHIKRASNLLAPRCKRPSMLVHSDTALIDVTSWTRALFSFLYLCYGILLILFFFFVFFFLLWQFLTIYQVEIGSCKTVMFVRITDHRNGSF